MNNKKEESEIKSKSYDATKSESRDEMPMYPMQNYNPCMCCPMMYEQISMQENIMNYPREAYRDEEEYRHYHDHYHNHNHGHNYNHLINQPVGVSLRNGQGVSGILCSVSNREIYLLQYLYHSQFATKHYPLNQIQDIYPFPKCHNPRWVY